jgi:hypothetical protein
VVEITMTTLWLIPLFLCLGMLCIAFAEPISKYHTSLYFKSKRSVQAFGAIIVIFSIIMLMVSFTLS